ncbi:MAG: sporulation transcription factor Spo0A [Halanaerobium sp.]
MEKIDILITDDNKEFCQLLGEFLEVDGDFNVVEMLYDGEQVLEYIKNNENPDVLILDLIMPHLDGIGVLEELNSQDLIDDIKIVALTAMGHDKIMKTVIELGVHYYIMKPFDLDKLKERIKQLVEESDGSTENIHFNQAQIEFENGNYTPLITNVIEELGIPAHIKGYRYVRQAIEMVIKDMDLLSAVTKELYPQIAEEFDSTSSRVERAIRHAIDVAWQRGNQEALKKYFKNNVNENVKPTNSQFIAKLADKIMVDLKVS